MATQNNQKEILRASLRDGWRLGLVAAVCSVIVTLSYLYAKPIIDKNKAEYQLQTLKAVFPTEFYDNELLQDVIEVPGFSLGETLQVHVARMGEQIVGYVFPITAPEGYSGAIDLVVGVTPAGLLKGARVVNHQETPGLGDKIDIKKSLWILNFTDKSLENPSEKQWKVKKDGGEFDSFTGATVTPRAVVNAIRDGLSYFERHKAAWAKVAQKPSTNIPDL